MIQTIKRFSEDIGMEFCIEKCVMLIMGRIKAKQQKEYDCQIRKVSDH